jgi:hypothetical protein
MLLQDNDCDSTSAIGSTHANAHRTIPTSGPSSENTEPRTQEQRHHQQLQRQEQCHPYQHHHHLEKNISKRRTPKKRRDIGNDIFVNSVKTLI